MTCDQCRWLLSMKDINGHELSRELRLHLDQCPSCRAFRRALAAVDEALTAWPSSAPEPSLLPETMRSVRLHPRPEIASPFSRTFWLAGMVATLLALVGGALLLHYGLDPWSASTLANSPLLNSTWPTNASSWLSVQSGQAAQVVLATMAGIMIAVAGAAIGLKAYQSHTNDL